VFLNGNVSLYLGCYLWWHHLTDPSAQSRIHPPTNAVATAHKQLRTSVHRKHADDVLTEELGYIASTRVNISRHIAYYGYLPCVTLRS
jgi:hypothetical protein